MSAVRAIWRELVGIFTALDGWPIPGSRMVSRMVDRWRG